MQSFSISRKLFLIAALVFILQFELGTVVAYQLNLADPGIGGSVRNHWMTAGTPITAPLVFMAPYILFLVLAFRRRWVGTLGVVGVTVLALISGLSWIPDHGMVQRVLEQHLNLWTGLTVALLALATPIIVVLGILTILRQREKKQRAGVMPESLPAPVDSQLALSDHLPTLVP
ncbi:MAG TPA: hypothetical protein VKT82_02300 [Ktedonobacterales bacterium]|nr:hypothetical protein [Ktedonobacterales bacterium]